MVRLLLALAILLCSFNLTLAADVDVGYAGSFKNIMHRGDISSKFSLSQLKDRDHIYALGAVENLKGEIQIFDGVSFVTFAEDGTLHFDNTFQRDAALIVYAQVPEWKEIHIPGEIMTRDEFEIYLQKVAVENGLDIEKPFPFLIAGTPIFIDWHVIDWKKGDMQHSHSKHITSGPHGRLEGAEALVLGFYSNKHKGIYIQHATNVHMHFKTIDNKLAGHVDDIELGKDMILKLPH